MKIFNFIVYDFLSKPHECKGQLNDFEIFHIENAEKISSTKKNITLMCF